MECCPAEEVLQRLLEGRPDDIEDGMLAAHLSQCWRCQERLDKLSDAADVRLSPPTPAATLSENWTAFLHGLAASPPHGVAARVPIPSPLVPCPPDYEILGELGRGGMGIVYKARHRRLHRLIALKCLLDPEAGPNRLARFRGEAEAAAKLSHAHIVQIYEIAEHEGRMYLALEYVDGGSLADRLAEAPVDSREAAGLLEVLARAMHAAHQQGVVHRDLKPSNILLHKAGGGKTNEDYSYLLPFVIPKITDFGLAKRVQDEDRLTQTGEILGTPEYMAPEQATGPRQEVGPLADVYALGAILYEMLTRRPPFQGITPFEVLKQICSTDDPPPPRQLNAKTPRDLETICLKCLAKEPRRRYADALALAEDVKRFLEGHPIEARPPGRLEIAAKWARRNRGWAVLLLAISVGLPVVSALALSLYLSRNNLASALGRETTERKRAEQAERTTREQAHAESVAAARVEAGRGLWDEALRLYDQAIADDSPDWADLEVERVRCLLPARHRQRLRDELNRLRDHDDLEEHQSQLLLYRATLLLTEQDRFKEGRELLRAALRHPTGLKTADQLFARGLLAETSDKAVALLRRALQEVPFHHPARSALVTELLVTGRLNEVRREAAVMRDFYRNDPLPDYVLALAAVMEGHNDARDRHLDALRPLLAPVQHKAVCQFLNDLASVLRLAEAIGRGENTMRNGLALAAKLPALQRQWLQGPDPIAMPAPAIARLFEAMEEMFAAYRGALFGDREAAVRRLLAAAQRHPESAILYLAAYYEFESAALAYLSKKDRKTMRAGLERGRDLAFRAAEAPTLLPNASFRFEARWLAVTMEGLLILEYEERVRMDATHVLLAPLRGNAWDVVCASLVSASRDRPAFRRPWLAEQLHQLAHQSRAFPKIRAEKFPLLIQSLEPEPALELLRQWQEDEPDAWRPQRLRAETEQRAGHHAAALERAGRVLRHPRASAADRKTMRSLQSTSRKELRRLLDLKSVEGGSE